MLHTLWMARSAPQILAKNLRWLMDRHQEDQVKLARRSGVPQRTISSVLKGETSPTLRTVEQLALAYGLPTYCLLLEDLHDNGDVLQRLNTLVTQYLAAPENTRIYLDHVAEREASYRRK